MTGKENRVSLSPSFSSYAMESGGAIFSAAVRVSGEEDERRWDDDGTADAEGRRGLGEEFEFPLSPDAAAAVAATSGRFFFFPVFNREIGGGRRRGDDEEAEHGPLLSLVLKDRDPPPSSTSSTEDEVFERVDRDRGHCLTWPSPKCSPRWCRKSKSTGSSSSSASPRGWSFRDLLRRSHSDGKGSVAIVFPDPKITNPKSENQSSKTPKNGKQSLTGPEQRPRRKRSDKAATAAAYYYSRNLASKDGDHGPRRIQSYLPYRQDLVGIFTGAGRSRSRFPPSPF